MSKGRFDPNDFESSQLIKSLQKMVYVNQIVISSHPVTSHFFTQGY